jgi:phosphate transport system substrate-binding protein
MRAAYSNVAIAALLAFPLLAGNAAAAETLHIAGTGGVLEAMRQIAPPFAAATGLNLEIITGLGTAGAMRALSDGVIDAVFAAREPKPDEAKVKLVARAFTRTPLVFVTSHRKPNGLKSSDIPAIFVAQNPKWEDGTPLKIILRTKVDADTVLVGWSIPGIAAAIEQARRRPDVPVAATDQDNVSIAQRLDGSLSFAGYGQIISEKCDLRLVPINGVVPSPATLANGTYPFEKLFYLVFAPNRSAGAEQLLRFLQSAEARNILLPIGYLPVGE